MRLLVVGAGSIGSVHAANAAELADRAAIFDHDTDRAEKAAGPAIEFLPSLRAALDWKPDGVVIATPHDTHLEIAEKFIAAGAHVLIEKPLAHTLTGVEAFLNKAEDVKRKVFVVCNMRYHPAVRMLRQNIGHIGKVHFARAWFGNYLPNMRPQADYRTLYCARRSRGGGVILDGIHEIDYLCWLLGDISAVRCEADRLSDLDIDVEDYAAIILRHANGARSEIHHDYLQQFKRRGCEIVGSAGTLIWNSEGKVPEHCTVKRFLSLDRQWHTLFESDDLDGRRVYREMLTDFISAIDSGREPDDLLTGWQAAHDLEVALGALESARVGKIIEFKEKR